MLLARPAISPTLLTILAKLSAGLANQCDTAFDLHRALPDQRLDIERRFGRALRQRAHLVGDDCKAAPGIPGTRRFNPGIEREQIGLERDAIDHRDDLADFPGPSCECRSSLAPLHRQRPPPAWASPWALCTESREMHCIARRAADTRCKRGHGGRGFLEAGGLLFGAPGEIIGGLADLLRAHVDCLRRSRDIGQRGADLRSHRFEIALDRGKLRRQPGERHAEIARRSLRRSAAPTASITLVRRSSSTAK